MWGKEPISQGEWRAVLDKSANAYVIESAINLFWGIVILSSFSVRRLPPIAPPKRVRRTERGADIGPSTRHPVFCFSRGYEEMTSSFQIWAAYAVALS